MQKDDYGSPQIKVSSAMTPQTAVTDNSRLKTVFKAISSTIDLHLKPLTANSISEGSMDSMPSIHLKLWTTTYCPL